MTIRNASADDVATVLGFVQKKAAFDGEVGAFQAVVRATEEALHRSMFGVRAFAHVLLLDDDDGVARGFALYYFRFSSFAGAPSLWLDDLFIDPEHRRGGAGALLMRRLVDEARAQGCTHLAWTAHERNLVGCNFYRKLGAELVDQQRHLLTWRLSL